MTCIGLHGTNSDTRVDSIASAYSSTTGCGIKQTLSKLSWLHLYVFISNKYIICLSIYNFDILRACIGYKVILFLRLSRRYVRVDTKSGESSAYFTTMMGSVDGWYSNAFQFRLAQRNKLFSRWGALFFLFFYFPRSKNIVVCSGRFVLCSRTHTLVAINSGTWITLNGIDKILKGEHRKNI